MLTGSAAVTFVGPTGLEEDAVLTFTLRVTDAGGLFSEDSVTVTVVAAETPALTAIFRNLPASHNGTNPFSFRVQFSEEIGISYVTLRDSALTVTNGGVTRARRVDGRNDLWEITVEPDSRDAVTITLSGGRPPGAVADPAAPATSPNSGRTSCTVGLSFPSTWRRPSREGAGVAGDAAGRARVRASVRSEMCRKSGS